MASDSYTTHPDIEERFLQPKGWRWHMFAGHNGEKLRFGTAFPKHTVPKAVIVILPGLTEFCEKYFELANTLMDKKYAVYVVEWQGQGRSYRHLKKAPHKRVSNGFHRDVQDLDILIREYVLPSAVHPDVGRLPLVMLAHSMGANIGLRYLKQHQGVFACAAMTAPMFGIKALKPIPTPLRVPLTKMFSEFADCSYVPGGRNYRPRSWDKKLLESMSLDPVRNKIHDAWMLYDPHLQVGGVTYRWLHYAARTCKIVQQKEFLKSIKTPILFLTAGREKLVSNNVTKRIANTIDHATLIDLPDSGHEILMERDEIRNQFLKNFDDLIKINILDKKDSVKPF